MTAGEGPVVPFFLEGDRRSFRTRHSRYRHHLYKIEHNIYGHLIIGQ